MKINDNDDKALDRNVLYDEVWAEPMTHVAPRYNLSDTGLRKTCKSLDIPLPPFGYWAKKRAGKPLDERPPLPPSPEKANVAKANESANSKERTRKKSSTLLEFRESDTLSMEELSSMKKLDILTNESKTHFEAWCKKQVTPERESFYHNLISRHRDEIEYRNKRDVEHPFGKQGVDFKERWEIKTLYRENQPVLPISVSKKQTDRAYRIMNAVLSGIVRFGAEVRVESSDTDNLHVYLSGVHISIEMVEEKVKRRHAKNISRTAFQPIYQYFYSGKLQLVWKIVEREHFSYRKKAPSYRKVYKDNEDISLETLLPEVFTDIAVLCCEHEIQNMREQKEYELDRCRKEQALQIEEAKAREEALLRKRRHFAEQIPAHAKAWEKHKRLRVYADDLEAYMSQCENSDIKRALSKYIVLVRSEMEKLDLLENILEELDCLNETSNK